MKAKPSKNSFSEFYSDELRERTSSGYDPYGYIDDHAMGSEPDSPKGEVCDFDWKEE